MSSEQMRLRISSQTTSLHQVMEHQCGSGREALLGAAAMIRGSRQVVLTGMGASYYALLPLEAHLCGLGINAIAVEAGELLHFRTTAYRDALVIAVSRSGESIEIARLLQALDSQQKVIGICNRAHSLLARKSHLAIEIASMEDDIVALQTYTGTVLALGLLGKALDEKLDDAREELERSFLPGFDALVKSSLERIQEWDNFLDTDATPYLLARGGSFASALEGALLFHEVSKAAAVAMPTASFRHGPVEVVDAAFRAFLFAPEEKTRHLNLALARDLVRFGGRVRLIGPASDDASGLPWITTPSSEALLAPVCEVVPLQVAAMRHAERRAILPGSFRFAPPVALDEASFGTSA